MEIGWPHETASFLAAFFASLVECVEALTIVLAVGSVRGWRGALAGSAAALIVLAAIVLTLGPVLTRIPLDVIQFAVGALLLLFGLRWLRKAVLRAVGAIPLHDESAAFTRETSRLRNLAPRDGKVNRNWDPIAFHTSFQIVMLEGTEVVFIVVAVGAGGGMLIPAGVGAVVALVTVIALGIAVHRPLASVPENSLKFVVGVLLSAFGTFWIGEGLAIPWPGGDWSILALIFGFLMTAAVTVALCQTRLRRLVSINAALGQR